ncbi:MAG: 16S rRNA (guanine(527)-N(7))-methyltransferase RsmG [Actinomycetota bacterium]
MDDEQRRRLERYAALLTDAPHNLLSPADRERAWERHVGESARIAEHLGVRDGERWIDVGTGGGLPGLVLAVLAPAATVVLLDATRKKIEAVAGFIETLGVANAVAVAGRAEALARHGEHRGRYDGAVARAVGPVSVSVELLRGFVRHGGEAVVVRGEDGPSCVPILEDLAPRLGIADVRAEAVPRVARATWLVRMRAEGPVPHGVPRADGVPRSRPLEG